MLHVLSSLVSWFLRILPTSAATAVTIKAICDFVRWFRRSRHQQHSSQSIYPPIRQQRSLVQNRHQSGRRQLPAQTQSSTVRSRKVYSSSKMDDRGISKRKKGIQLPPE
jgi:hypothetical protein